MHLTEMQFEILQTLWMHEEWIIQIDQAQFPFIYVVREPGKMKGIYYPSTPVVGLMKRGYIKPVGSMPGDFGLDLEKLHEWHPDFKDKTCS